LQPGTGPAGDRIPSAFHPFHDVSSNPVVLRGVTDGKCTSTVAYVVLNPFLSYSGDYPPKALNNNNTDSISCQMFCFDKNVTVILNIIEKMVKECRYRRKKGGSCRINIGKSYCKQVCTSTNEKVLNI
jgi:hypothetical protein